MEILREKGKERMTISKSETSTVEKLEYLTWGTKVARGARDQSIIKQTTPNWILT